MVGLGGGSALALAKAVALLLRNDSPITSYAGWDKAPAAPAPSIALPTTAGSGSEVSNALVLHDPEQESIVVIRGHGYEPRVAILDGAAPAHAARAGRSWTPRSTRSATRSRRSRCGARACSRTRSRWPRPTISGTCCRGCWTSAATTTCRRCSRRARWRTSPAGAPGSASCTRSRRPRACACRTAAPTACSCPGWRRSTARRCGRRRWRRPSASCRSTSRSASSRRSARASSTGTRRGRHPGRAGEPVAPQQQPPCDRGGTGGDPCQREQLTPARASPSRRSRP